MSGLLEALGAQAIDAAPALRPAASQHAPAPRAEVPAGESPEVDAFDRVSDAEATTHVPMHETGRSADALAPTSTVRTRPSKADASPRALPAVGVRPTARHPEVSKRSRPDREVDAPRRATQASHPALPSVRPRHRAWPTAIAPTGLRGGSTNATTPQAPDVHIHIGRIEVVAPTPPAAPKRTRAAPTHASTSLGDYLRRGIEPP